MMIYWFDIHIICFPVKNLKIFSIGTESRYDNVPLFIVTPILFNSSV